MAIPNLPEIPLDRGFDFQWEMTRGGSFPEVINPPGCGGLAAPSPPARTNQDVKMH